MLPSMTNEQYNAHMTKKLELSPLARFMNALAKTGDVKVVKSPPIVPVNPFEKKY